MRNSSKPIALDAYEKLAHGYSQIAESKAENGYNEHPAIRRVIGDVRGKTVLDAGCGPGFLVRDLLRKEAGQVTGFDISPSMINIARQRIGDLATLFVGDLGQPIALADSDYDLIVSSLAMDYVRDWSVPLSEFRRLLRPNGRLIFSVQHPLGSFSWLKPPTAFGIHYCETTWRVFTKEPVVVPDFYRSFEEIMNPVIQAGFQLTKIVETKPIEALRKIDPRKYQKGSTFPTFMVIDAKLSSQK